MRNWKINIAAIFKICEELQYIGTMIFSIYVIYIYIRERLCKRVYEILLIILHNVVLRYIFLIVV